jgi:hypothetical protein
MKSMIAGQVDEDANRVLWDTLSTYRAGGGL